MGDAADDDFDDGFDTWIEHIDGRCDDVVPCEYCEIERKKRLHASKRDAATAPPKRPSCAM